MHRVICFVKHALFLEFRFVDLAETCLFDFLSFMACCLIDTRAILKQRRQGREGDKEDDKEDQ